MDSYCNFDNAFSNTNNDNLDKLARKINNDNKKPQFNNDVMKIINYNNSNGFFSTQGNYSDNDNSNNFELSDDIKSSYSFNTLNSDSAHIINEMSSNYSSLPSKIKNNMRLNTKHLKDFNETDEIGIINHLKKCDECKTELLYTLLSNNKEKKYNTKNNIVKNDIVKNDIIKFNIGNNELIHIVILILIGIFIIIIIDSFLNR